ncbi:hypothetical protein HDV00_000418 [Rhizophlyctis rosea]|nr:hypothetical protein HDV00_000418 [Rhizophlyctis rosea]
MPEIPPTDGHRSDIRSSSPDGDLPPLELPAEEFSDADLPPLESTESDSFHGPSQNGTRRGGPPFSDTEEHLYSITFTMLVRSGIPISTQPMGDPGRAPSRDGRAGSQGGPTLADMMNAPQLVFGRRFPPSTARPGNNVLSNEGHPQATGTNGEHRSDARTQTDRLDLDLDDFMRPALGALFMMLFRDGPGNGHTQGQPPASEAAIANLPVITLADRRRRKHKLCTICQDEFNEVGDTVPGGGEVLQLRCHHLYHRMCITQWLRNSNTCPTCRYELETDYDDYNIGVRERMAERDRTIATDVDTDNEDDGQARSIAVFESERTIEGSPERREVHVSSPPRGSSRSGNQMRGGRRQQQERFEDARDRVRAEKRSRTRRSDGDGDASVGVEERPRKRTKGGRRVGDDDGGSG